jgi:hypothetical protein
VPAPRPTLAVLGACLLLGSSALPLPGEHTAGFDTITEDDVAAHLRAVASAPLEGRDSPSAGLTRAGDYIVERLQQAGLTGAGKGGEFRLPWSRDLPAPKEGGCKLVLEAPGAEPVAFAFGKEFMPLVDCNGSAQGHPVFCGFGISSKKEKYDDLKGVDLKDNVALILEGEPRHKRRFEGALVTPEADVHVKLRNLADAGAAAVVIVRRPAPDQPADLPPPALSFRYTWAAWNASERQRDPEVPRKLDLAVVEVTPEVGSRILGADVLALAAKLDESAKPDSGAPGAAVLRVASATERRAVPIDNIGGVLRGADPELADEYVVVGAHYDHVGVGVRGQIAYGADDNGSGTSAMLEVVEALAASRPRRSILACAFSGEEDALLGSQQLVRAPPVPLERMVAMLNLDMIGRGEAGVVVVLGTEESPDLEKVLERAQRLHSPKVKAVTGKAHHLWQRSDHFSFYEAGVPVLFFFESESELDNPDYHTWRDTLDLVNTDKVARTARLTFNAAWILAEDDEVPSRPRG